MTIFDHLNSILFTKKRDTLTNVDDESTFSPYMTNRWISMYSSDLANIINNTSNRYINCFNKQEFYNFLSAVLPRVRFKRIAYIKKKTEKKDEKEQNIIELIAKSREISIREARELVKLNI